jgi:hypothetical protein
VRRGDNGNYREAELSKPLTRFYPIDIARRRWLPARDLPTGGEEKLLALDPSRGSSTRLLRVLPGVETPAFNIQGWEESYVLEGSYKSGDEFYPAGTYLCRKPGTREGPVTTTKGFTAIQFRDPAEASRGKSVVALRPFEIEIMPWAPTALGNPAHVQKILSASPGGSITRLLLVYPRGDTIEMDDHEIEEEVLILKGNVKNGEEFHPAGTYTCNPPHSKHGPFLVDEELLCLEIRNYG